MSFDDFLTGTKGFLKSVVNFFDILKPYRKYMNDAPRSLQANAFGLFATFAISVVMLILMKVVLYDVIFSHSPEVLYAYVGILILSVPLFGIWCFIAHNPKSN